MNAPHIHLLLNHFPVIGTFFGILVLAAGFLIKNEWVRNTAYGIFIVTSLLSIPAFLSGGQAEEAIENLPGIEETYVETHEEMAEVAIWMVEALGILNLIALWMSLKGNSLQKQLSLFTLALAIATFVMIARVNNSGGEIRHPEIRSGSVLAPEGAKENGEEAED